MDSETGTSLPRSGKHRLTLFYPCRLNEWPQEDKLSQEWDIPAAAADCAGAASKLNALTWQLQTSNP